MRREISATVDGREVAVTVELAADGRWQVSVDGQEARLVDAVEIRPGTWSLLCDGASLVVDLDRRSQGPALLFAGAEARVDLVDARQRRLAQAVGQGTRASVSGEVVRAPIAGKVVKLLVAAGDEVAAGQGVAVLEAMKMENEIRADRGGVVEKVHASPGQSVDAQEPLFTLR
ncbi:MAG TPA: biotin/lipoyl-containing protein [Kofleriaceae bacterium]|nr:biotin/lipoyl-containing protein [Kofleriaceae bacterium]